MRHQNTHDKIIDNLFVGSASALQENNIFSLIVNCTRDVRFPKYCNHCIRVPIDDDPDNSSRLLSAINDTMVIEEMHSCISKNEDVLVHCFAGIQRSCTIVACYLMKYHDMNPMEAIGYIQTKRPVAFIGNVNFLSTIEAFYRNNTDF